MCTLDGDAAEVWSEDRRVARKNYACSICGGRIRVGDKHLYNFTVTERIPCLVRVCLPCADDREEFVQAHGHYYPHPTTFLDELRNCVDDEGDKWRPMLERIRKRIKTAEGAPK